MKIDSRQTSFSFQKFWEEKQNAAQEMSKKDSDSRKKEESENIIAGNIAAVSLATERSYDQFTKGRLDITSTETETNGNNITGTADALNSQTPNNPPAVFKAQTSQHLNKKQNKKKGIVVDHLAHGANAKANAANSSNKNAVAFQIEEVQANGGTRSGVVAGSRVFHGTSTSAQMQARQAGKQAENSLLLKQMARQSDLIAAAVADGAGAGSGGAAARIRSNRRVEFEKNRSILENAEAQFEKAKEEKKEEAKKTQNSESTGENTDAIITSSDGENITSAPPTPDSTENTSTGDSGEVSITTSPDSSTTTDDSPSDDSGSIEFNGIDIIV